MKDIRINMGRARFKFRTCGIIRRGNKILLSQEHENVYSLPGGHVEITEESKSAAEREMREETGFKVRVFDLNMIVENFFIHPLRGLTHEICFYYDAEFVNEEDAQQDYIKYENDQGHVLKHNFKWVTRKELESLNFYPSQLKDELFKNEGKIKHIVIHSEKARK